MGKKWDNTGIAYNVDMWKECLRVLKPGGHLLSFSGTRTYHRMAVAIEDAGFEIRDMIEWVYGSGFPKSLNIGKAVDKLQGNEREAVWNDRYKDGKTRKTGDSSNWELTSHAGSGGNGNITTKGTSEWEGWGTALKPAHEPICMARKPLSEKTVAENCLKWGTGGINIDESRVISDTDAYKDGGNSESIVLLRKSDELHHKLYTLFSVCVVDKKDCRTPANDGECVAMWRTLADCLDDYSLYSRLYDGLSHLFQEDALVSFQELHDALGDIDRLRKEQSNNLSSPHNDHLSSLDDFYQLIYSYLDDTTQHIKSQGRFPANLITDGSEEVRECFPDVKTGGRKIKTNCGDAWYKQNVDVVLPVDINNGGNASRFFKSIIYQAKASKSERNKGCEGLEEKRKKVAVIQTKGVANDGEWEDGKQLSSPMKNNHPTVKPIALMEYLIKMVTRKGGIVLDPFMGSGSTGVACIKNGFGFIGIEREDEYIKICKARMEEAQRNKDSKLF